MATRAGSRYRLARLQGLVHRRVLCTSNLDRDRLLFLSLLNSRGINKYAPLLSAVPHFPRGHD